MSDNLHLLSRRQKQCQCKNLRLIERNLEGRSHVLSSHGRNKLFSLKDLADFGCQQFPVVGLLLASALLKHLPLVLSDMICTPEHTPVAPHVDDRRNLINKRETQPESNQSQTTYHKSFLDTRFACPPISMRSALDKDSVRIPASIPPKTEGDGIWRLVQPIVIQLELVVVQINRVG